MGALKMIHDKTSRFKAFFSNRLSKIHAGSHVDEWRYVDSANNPADHTSRGIAAHESEKWANFHHGPDFLKQPEDDWPITILQRPNTSFTASVLAMAAAPVHAVPPHLQFILFLADKNGKWIKKLRIIAVARKAAKRWRKAISARTRKEKGEIPEIFPITATDIEEAELDLIRAIQCKYFHLEMEELTKKGVIDHNIASKCKKSSALRPHNPFVDGDGILRVGSRIMHADVSYDAKFPAILPPKDDNVRALIRHFHQLEHHAGPKHTLSVIRSRFWINQGLQATKSTLHLCVGCQRLFKRPASQMMAPLPPKRVTPAAPFEETGVDLLGPVLVKMNGRADHKTWVAVFTCMASRAVHAEVVFKIDADSMVNAISRFSARRPGVRRFTSDRGTNLVGANGILKKQMEAWNASSSAELQRRGLQWDFIPASTPHYGGVWERVVALFKKRLLSATAGDVLYLDVFNTYLVEIEGILNRRPLTALSTDSSDATVVGGTCRNEIPLKAS